jgi:hypothetical protein
MATWRVNNSTALGGEVCSPWQADHTYATGARCVCTVAYATTAARAFVYEVTSGGGGKSHATTQPSWPTTVGNTVVDNAITWTCRSPSDGSWDNASCYLAYVLNHAAAAAGGDAIYVDDGHSETNTISTFYGSTSVSNPTKIYCVDKASDALSTGAVVTLNDWSSFFSFIRHGYSYGVCFTKSGYGARVDGTVDTNYTKWVFETSGPTVNVFDLSELIAVPTLEVKGISSSSDYSYPIFMIKNAGVALKHVDSRISATVGTLRLYNVKFTNANEITYLIKGSYSGSYGRGYILIEDSDLTALCTGATNRYLLKADEVFLGTRIDVMRCKLPAGAGFVMNTGTPTSRCGDSKLRLYHSSSANRTYDFYEYDFVLGVSEDETTIVRTGGASDGTTGISCKMVSSANCVENIIALESIPITGWTSSTTSKTFTVEGVWDSATNIQDDEIWMELEYPANNTDGLGAIAKDKCAILGTPADQTASTETWTGTGGFSNENKFKLSVTVTPGKAGPICARVYLAKASTTVYIDPMITES